MTVVSWPFCSELSLEGPSRHAEASKPFCRLRRRRRLRFSRVRPSHFAGTVTAYDRYGDRDMPVEKNSLKFRTITAFKVQCLDVGRFSGRDGRTVLQTIMIATLDRRPHACSGAAAV